MTDLEAAIDALRDATPQATDEEIGALLRDRFPEVFERNRRVLFDLGLSSLIERERGNHDTER